MLARGCVPWAAATRALQCAHSMSAASTSAYAAYALVGPYATQHVSKNVSVMASAPTHR